MHSHRPTIAHGPGPRRAGGPPGSAPGIPACAHGNGGPVWRRAACAVRPQAHPASYTAKPRAGGWRGWLLASPRPPCPFAPPRRLCNRPTLRPVADVRMPVHATIMRGRRHLRVALEIIYLEQCSSLYRSMCSCVVALALCSCVLWCAHLVDLSCVLVWRPIS